ncbi:MAG: hypothetical protein D6824_07345, partial [Planctomycetota bacterium]
LRCLRRPRPEVWTSPLVQWGMAVAMPIPRIADAAIRGMVRRRRELRRGAVQASAPTQRKAAASAHG